MKLFLLLDTSGSMEGAKIGALNDAMSNIIVSLQGYAYDNGASIELAILHFARKAKWMYDKPKPILDFAWKELHANGMTSLGAACLLLSEALEKENGESGEIVIVLVSDGCPTDDYEGSFAILNQNKTFSTSIKFAIALGEDADIPSLLKFTSSQENIYYVQTVDTLLDALGNVVQNGINDSKSSRKIVVTNDDDDYWD